MIQSTPGTAGSLCFFLSEQHAAATTDAHRAPFLAAGETIWNVLIASRLFRLGRDVSEEVKLRRS